MKWIKILHWACRIFLAWLWIYAGYTKIQSPLQFAGAIEGYATFSRPRLSSGWPILCPGSKCCWGSFC